MANTWGWVRVVLVVLSCAGAACDCSSERGRGAGDAGGATDTGVPVDAGADMDAGSTDDAAPADTGSRDTDAGMPATDAGRPATDAATQPDTGAGPSDCPLGDPGPARAAFTRCPDGMHVGQTMAAAGLTCEHVCCALGFAGCIHRAAQADFDACTPAMPPMSGSCADVFMPAWSSQCLCR